MDIRPEFQVTRDAVVRRRRKPRAEPPVINAVKVDQRVWEAALQAVDGDPGRIEIRSATEVFIHNSTDWKAS